MGGEICTDNRFEIIAAYKKTLIECTNIESSPEEMAVLDNILFRFWQMNWLPPEPHGDLIDRDALISRLDEGIEIISMLKLPEDFKETYNLVVNGMKGELGKCPVVIPRRAEHG